MHHIIYTSQATKPLSEAQVQALLAQAQMNNAALQVTGALLYGNNQFLQVLEGEQATIQTLYERICQDSRHHNVLTYANKEVPTRAFAEWSMAYHPIDPLEFHHFAQFVSPEELQLARPNLSEIDRLLLLMLRSYVLPGESDEPASGSDEGGAV